MMTFLWGLNVLTILALAFGLNVQRTFLLKATKYILETTQLFRESDTFLPLFRLTNVIPDNSSPLYCVNLL